MATTRRQQNINCTQAAIYHTLYCRDIGIIHKDGSLEILGRKSDIMRFKVKQNVVFPTKIEEVLATYPGVAEAVVRSPHNL